MKQSRHRLFRFVSPNGQKRQSSNQSGLRIAQFVRFVGELDRHRKGKQKADLCSASLAVLSRTGQLAGIESQPRRLKASAESTVWVHSWLSPRLGAARSCKYRPLFLGTRKQTRGNGGPDRTCAVQHGKGNGKRPLNPEAKKHSRRPRWRLHHLHTAAVRGARLRVCVCWLVGKFLDPPSPRDLDGSLDGWWGKKEFCFSPRGTNPHLPLLSRSSGRTAPGG
uniref:Uncharacterized protein n=1 Tax=Anopheles atroparvus TaxID=41427 RepID=A0AAG5DB90_ANOAO